MKLSNLVVIYPNRCKLKGSDDQQTISEHIVCEEISSATSEIREWKSASHLNTSEMYK